MPRYQRPIGAGGFFTRGFGGASGIGCAAILFILVAVGLPIILFCGGCGLFISVLDNASKQHPPAKTVKGAR